MTAAPLDRRVPLMMSAAQVKSIDDWMFRNRVRSRAEAIRWLVQMALAQADNLTTERRS